MERVVGVQYDPSDKDSAKEAGEVIRYLTDQGLAVIGVPCAGVLEPELNAPILAENNYQQIKGLKQVKKHITKIIKYFSWPTVRGIAKRTVKIHKLSAREVSLMFSLIPRRTLNSILSISNRSELREEIDKIRFKKEDELAKLLGLNLKKKRHKTLDREMLSRMTLLPHHESLDLRRKEIHFLFSVGTALTRQ